MPPAAPRRCGFGASARNQRFMCACRDGKSRCFGFVGFRSPVEAEAALRYFSKSFFDTMRLDIEVGADRLVKATGAALSLSCQWAEHTT